MAFSEDTTLANLSYLPYHTEAEYTLSEGDGKKTIYAWFKDKANNVSTVVADDIVLDVTAPKDGLIIINGGAKETDDINKFVQLKISATDAQLMQISNLSSFSGARWQLYEPEVRNWRLAGEEDGLRSVYVRFKDKAGNVSRPFKSDIILSRGE